MITASEDLASQRPSRGTVGLRGGEEMCFERRNRDEELGRERRPTREDIRQLFERYGRPSQVSENVGEEAESAGLNGLAERPESVSRSPREEPVGLR
jgi:hypothetical protein